MCSLMGGVSNPVNLNARLGSTRRRLGVACADDRRGVGDVWCGGGVGGTSLPTWRGVGEYR